MFRHWIKNATAEVHQRLHHHPILAPLTSGDVTMAQYLRALTGLHGIFAPMESCLSKTSDLAFRSPRSALLEADIRALAGETAETRLRVLASGIPVWTDADRPLGACYVLDGTAFGGRSMVGHLRVRLGLAETGTTFMGSVGVDIAGEWRTLMTMMGDRAGDEHAAERMMDGAIATFAAIERWLDTYHRDGGRAAA